ncbi:MAG: hypothetical protein JSU96_04930 [Acidobacteriota bacterium]|nr:MAG: hypothetical protein JSU96_04930 [Acidobacteriota bacterium]
MNWMRVLLAGVVSGIVATIANFVMHGVIMAGAYTKHQAFAVEEQANPLHFLLIAVCAGIMVAILFAKTQSCWAPGIAGGATFGLFVGLAYFFMTFYYPLVIAGFPYHMGWCWAGIDLIQFVVYGAVIGALYKK